MSALVAIISSLVIIVLIWFWAWMLRHMLNNEYILPNAKNYWMFAFAFLNIFAAMYYYVYVYRNR